MENLEFAWKDGELLTKQRLDEFIYYLRGCDGIQNSYQSVDYGFGYCRSQKILIECDDSLQVTVKIPAMNIVFPNGYLIMFAREIQLSGKYQPNNILSLSLSSENPKSLGLSYFPGQMEAYLNNCLPLAVLLPDSNDQADNYLKPVLNIGQANQYAGIITRLKCSVECCEESIKNYFITRTDSKPGSANFLKETVFQAFLGELLSLKTVIRSQFHGNKSTMLRDGIGSVSFFALFKKLLIMTDSFEPYFNQIEAQGVHRKPFTERESIFLAQLRSLLTDIDFIHFQESITNLCEWMDKFSNMIAALSGLQEAPAGGTQHVTSARINDDKKKTHSWI